MNRTDRLIGILVMLVLFGLVFGMAGCIAPEKAAPAPAQEQKAPPLFRKTEYTSPSGRERSSVEINLQPIIALLLDAAKVGGGLLVGGASGWQISKRRERKRNGYPEKGGASDR